MKLIQIEQILEISRIGSITKAACNLYISQPNLSLSVKRLEAEIGTPIFQRTSTGVKLTRFGKKFVSYAQSIMDNLNLLNSMCTRQSIAAPIMLDIGSTGYKFVSMAVVELYNRYRNHPFNIKYIESSPSDLIHMLENEDIEIGIMNFWSFSKKTLLKQLTFNNIDFHQLTAVPAGVCISKSNPSYRPNMQSVRIDMLRNSTLIDYCPNGIYTDELLEKLGYTGQINRINVDNRTTMYEMLSMTNGFAIIPLLESGTKNTGSGNLCCVPIADSPISCEIGWIQKNNT